MIFVTRATRMLHSKANGDETENAGTNEKREKGKKKEKKKVKRSVDRLRVCRSKKRSRKSVFTQADTRGECDCTR